MPLLPFARIAWEVEVHSGELSSESLRIEPNKEPREVMLR